MVNPQQGVLLTHGCPGALKRQIQCDFNVCCSALLISRLKSSSVPNCGWIAVCPPSSDPIAHGLPGSSGPADGRVVLPFAVSASDRMNRREI